jgi:3-oxoacyl-[acyl-carrier-protein] synthase III
LFLDAQIVINIAGVGFAYPKTQISNQLLSELSPNFMRSLFESDTSIKERYSALNLNYLVETKNSDLTASFSNLVESDLELAERAITAAVQQAGIQLSDVGLVIGETSTPFQTIPSQSQRVAGFLGLKVKAYDILAGAASPCLHLATLASWRQERLPDYVLLIYSNLPTVFIDYAAVTPNSARLSDAVAAVVISTKEHGALKVISANSKSDVSLANEETIDMFGPLQISNATEAVIESKLEVVANEALVKCPRGPKRNYFIPSQIAPTSIKRLGAVLGFAGEEVLISPYGDSFSSSQFGPLTQLWNHLASGDRVYMAMCGLGLQFGHVVLEVN